LGISALALAVLMLASPYAYAGTSSITGYWVITQAATQSNGQAPTVVACGSFNLNDITPVAPNIFTAVISFSLTYPSESAYPALGLTIPGINGVSAEPVGIKESTPIPGVLFVGFRGSTLSGSFTSPSSLPHPSIDPSKVGCNPFLQPEFLGLVHLPKQGTQGMTIYGLPVTAL
ncbi:MAG: hypothetical protein HYU03_06680, partial [Thaumarchaeota archaeon]|nr:hypothetical protein [Nitrososphaerota archaeon]